MILNKQDRLQLAEGEVLRSAAVPEGIIGKGALNVEDLLRMWKSYALYINREIISGDTRVNIWIYFCNHKTLDGQWNECQHEVL